MIPVTKHQAVNEIYICATSALTDDQTLVTKKKKSMPAGGKRRDYTYETSSLSILCIPCASRRLRIEECGMTATWLLPCGRPNITALTGKKKEKEKAISPHTRHHHHICTKVVLTPPKSRQPARDQKSRSSRSGDGIGRVHTGASAACCGSETNSTRKPVCRCPIVPKPCPVRVREN